MESQVLRKRVRRLLVFFITALVLSGLTAVPLKWEVDILESLLGEGTVVERAWPALSDWISYVHAVLTEMHENHRFIFYGTDWLAFAHVVIAVAFWGPLKDPVKNVWVVEFGMIACVLVLPLALIFGPIRGIPFFWRLFDCSFGVFGIIPLWLARNSIERITYLESNVA